MVKVVVSGAHAAKLFTTLITVHATHNNEPHRKRESSMLVARNGIDNAYCTMAVTGCNAHTTTQLQGTQACDSSSVTGEMRENIQMFRVSNL
jgi:hypothetical protein